NNGSQLLTLFSRVQQMGVVTTLDFSLPDADSESGKLNWPKVMRRILPFTDVFMPSLEEALLVMMPHKYDAIRRLSDKEDMVDYISPDIIRDVGKRVNDCGVKILLIKARHKGLYLLTQDITAITERTGLDLREQDRNNKELRCHA